MPVVGAGGVIAPPVGVPVEGVPALAAAVASAADAARSNDANADGAADEDGAAAGGADDGVLDGDDAAAGVEDASVGDSVPGMCVVLSRYKSGIQLYEDESERESEREGRRESERAGDYGRGRGASSIGGGAPQLPQNITPLGRLSQISQPQRSHVAVTSARRSAGR